MTRTIKSRALALVMALALLYVTGVGLALAQTDSNQLNIGDTVTGTLDVQNFARTYTFQARTGDLVTITAESESTGLALALLLTDPNGQLLNRAAEPVRPNVTIADVAITTDGLYIITVMRLSGAQGNVSGNFSLTLTGTPSSGTGDDTGNDTDATEAPTLAGSTTLEPTPATPATTAATQTPTTVAGNPVTVTLTEGLSVTLNWSTADDMNLEVRDPVGGAVNFRTATVPSGGRLANNVNGDCSIASAASPTETISWPGGVVPTGSYEIIIYYNQRCTSAPVAPPAEATTTDGGAAPTTAAESISFVVTVTVNGDALEPIRGTLNPNQQYLASFRLEDADRVTLLPGGPNLSIRLDPFASDIAAPEALNARTSVTGTITTANAVDAWSIDIPANTTNFAVSMVANSGSLDPLLVMLDPGGAILTTNDDANENTRNAQIIHAPALAAGRYIIVATRFGLDIGGTEGTYALSIGTQATAANNTGGTTATLAPVPTTVTTGAGGAPSLPSGSIEITLQWNTRADMRLLVRDPGGVSVYADAQQPDNGGIMDRMGNFNCEDTTTSPVTYVYWPTGVLNPGTYEVGVWLNDRCEDQQSLPLYTLSVRVRGQEVIKVDQRPDPNKIHYLTTFTVAGDGTATAGPAGLVQPIFSADISQQISNDPPVIAFASPIRSTIDQTKPFEVYTFEGKQGDRIAIVMRNVGGNLDPHLFLLNANGVQITENDDVEPGADSNSRIEQRITVDGTYYVIASRYGVELGGTQGNYELTIARMP